MFDGSRQDEVPAAERGFAGARRRDEALSDADPVELLHMLEQRLAQAEQTLQAHISDLDARVSTLEREVAEIGTPATSDVRSLEREMTEIAERLARLEDRAA